MLSYAEPLAGLVMGRCHMLSIGTKTVFSLAMLGASLLILSACANTSAGKVAGSYIPNFSTSTNTLVSELGNGLLGNNSAQLPVNDRQKALEAEYQALEYSHNRKPVAWKGASDLTTGEVVAATPYQVGSQNCRQYTHSYTINGVPQTVKGTACRNPNGSWSLLN